MKWFTYSLLLILTACSNLPPAIDNPPLVDISYPQAVQAIGNYQSAQVRWGGVVIDVENEQTSSIVQILSYPLNHFGRPRLDKPSQGRFIVKTAEFIDPAVYTKNSEITVAGILKGDEARMIGKKELRLPVVASSVIYLWPVESNTECYGPGAWGGVGYSPYFGYSPYYWGGYYYGGPYRRWR